MTKLDFLLKYVSMDTYKKILDTKSAYYLEDLGNSYRNFNLNMEYLYKYGICFGDRQIYNNLSDLMIESFYEKKIIDLEKRYSKSDIIALIENID